MVHRLIIRSHENSSQGTTTYTVMLAEKILAAIAQPICTLSLKSTTFGFVDHANAAYLNQIQYVPDAHTYEFVSNYLDSRIDQILFKNELRALSSTYRHSTVLSVSVAVVNGKRKTFHLLLSYVDDTMATVQFQDAEIPSSNASREFVNDHAAVLDLIENAPKPCQVVDDSNIILYANKAMLNLMQCAGHEYIGKKITTFLESRNVEEYREICDKAVINPGSYTYNRLILRNKHNELMECMLCANRREFGDCRSYTRSFIREYSEKLILDEAEKRVQDTNDILELKRTFVRYVSHETRSPLCIVYGKS